MVPPAPPRFSTSTGWPIVSCMRAPTKRAMMSVVAPAGNGTMMRIGFDGKGSATAALAQSAKQSASSLVMAPLRSSIGFDARLLDELRILHQFARDHRLEVRDRHRQRIGAELLDLAADLRRLHERGDLLVQALDDGA